MKLIAPLALTAVSAQTFNTISYRFRDSVAELSALYISDAGFAAQVFNHGCWCAKLSQPGSVALGGNAPVDDLDQICKNWARARRCSRGGVCEFAAYDSTYEVEDGQLCPDSDSCMSETCQIDLFYINEINDWRTANPQAFTPNTSPMCPPHTSQMMNNCEPFSTTVRPTTTGAMADDVADALNDNGIDNSQKNIGVTLSWPGANGCDMDLWVEDPTGESTGYSNNPSSSGGSLDIDQYGHNEMNIENISWEVAMSGTYHVRLHSFDSCSIDNTLTLYIHRDGQVDEYTYFMPAYSDWIDAVSFTYDAANRLVLPPYTGPEPNYYAPKN